MVTTEPEEGVFRRGARQRWLIAVAALLLVFEIGRHALAQAEYLRHLWSDAWWTATSLASAIACWTTARRMRERHLRVAWTAFGGGSFAFFLGMLVWDFHELVQRVYVPFPSVADAGFVGITVFFIVGTFFYKARQPSATLTLKQIGDLGIIGAALLVADVEILYEPLRRTTLNVADQLVSMAHPLAHLLALFFGVVCLWQHVWGRRRVVLGLHLTGMAMLTVAETIYGEQLLLRSYDVGAWLDGLWVATFLFIASAARGEAYLSEADDRQQPSEEPPRWDALVPALALLAFVIVGVTHYERPVQLVPLQAIAGGVLVGSFALRIWATQELERRLIAKITREESRARQLQTRLFHAQKMEAVGTLAGGVAHDFNNVLHAGIAGIGLIRRKLARGVDVTRDLDEIERAVWRATDLTGRLLSIARKREARPALLDPGDAVAHVAALLAKVLPKNIELVIKGAPGAPPIEVDPAGLEHAVLNLCLNARDAMKDAGGTLTIEVGTATGYDGVSGDAVTITVRDTGAGIPPDVLPRVFEPFFTTKGPGTGTGLGLAMVEAFVGENRGSISVDSEPGHGAAFRMAFPAHVSEHAAHEALPQLTGTVIVIDVGDTSGLAAAGVLERCGFETIVVSTPEEAIEAARGRADDIEVVVADAASGMAGREAVRALRDAGVDAPIILIAGAGSDPSGDWALVVRKPVDARDLANAVRHVVSAGEAATARA